MSSRGARYRVRLLTGAVLPLLAGWLFFPGTATASCGNYVAIGAPGTADDHGPMPSAPHPCPGPTCERGKLPPPLPPVSPPPPRGDDRLCPVPADAPAALPTATRPAHEAAPRPVRRGPSVFHPPR